MNNTLLAFLVVVVCMISCRNAVTISTPAPPPDLIAYNNVPEDFWIFFQLFEREAYARGRSIDLREIGITASIEEIHRTTGFVGLCSNQEDPNHIMIDEGFWNQASSMKKELIILHELGHCVLKRSHNDDAEGGVCKSIMRAGDTACIADYNKNTRAIYLDELFSNIPIEK